MELRMLKRKLCFFNHLFTLESDSLAHKVVIIQERESFPGLVKECQSQLVKLGLSNLDPTSFSKQSWKRMITKKIHEENIKQLLEDMEGYKKVDQKEMMNEKFEVKEYFKTLTLTQARMRFAIRTHQVRTIKMNQMNNKQYSSQLWQCISCQGG